MPSEEPSDPVRVFLVLPAPIPLSRRKHSVWNGGPGVRPLGRWDRRRKDSPENRLLEIRNGVVAAFLAHGGSQLPWLHKRRMVAKLTSRMVAELTYREGEYNLRGSSAPNSRRTC